MAISGCALVGSPFRSITGALSSKLERGVCGSLSVGSATEKTLKTRTAFAPLMPAFSSRNANAKRRKRGPGQEAGFYAA